MSKTVICPKCSHVRPPDATNPEWQCPACEVCYAKAGVRDDSKGARTEQAPVQVAQGWDWGTLVKIVVFVLAGWAITQGISSIRGGGSPDDRLRDAAAGAVPSDIVLYSAPWCGYCKVAKEIFAANSVPYLDCDTEADPRCMREFKELEGTGVPLFVVRGKRLDEGLNYDALISALNEDRSR